MGISRYLAKFLPRDRPYTELEAMYSLQLDYWEGNDASVAGYAEAWTWSRTRVRTFLSNASAEINGSKGRFLLGKICPTKRTGTDTGTEQEGEQVQSRYRAGARQVRMINIKGLDGQGGQVQDRLDTGTEQVSIQVQSRILDTTIERERESKRDKLPTTPLPPAGGSEASAEREGGNDQPPDPPLPTVADPPKQAEQTGKGKRAKKEIPPESEKFLTFWANYPNKQGRAKAWEKWSEWKLDSQADAIMAALDGFRRSEGWLKDNGRFVPHGSTWINQRRWLDMAEVAAPRQPAQRNGSAVDMDEMIRKAIEAKRIETCGSDAL